ncbi:MAG: hypothetical protein CVV05_00105 [Gammaproteobacteria bacterium HGW-Gammaproteobacteria-1]|jgi:hypothetical protein|nr:MAG: hypothetical protein CVV05_00105 [Gammaproteobacteria bacterium HGW-Gammaproteobacteria-1]
MATYPIDDNYEATVSRDGKVGSRLYRSTASIVQKSTQKIVHRVYGEGAAATAADRRAVDEARYWVASHARDDE